jgi:hypothetical protein
MLASLLDKGIKKVNYTACEIFVARIGVKMHSTCQSFLSILCIWAGTLCAMEKPTLENPLILSKEQALMLLEKPERVLLPLSSLEPELYLAAKLLEISDHPWPTRYTTHDFIRHAAILADRYGIPEILLTALSQKKNGQYIIPKEIQLTLAPLIRQLCDPNTSKDNWHSQPCYIVHRGHLRDWGSMDPLKWIEDPMQQEPPCTSHRVTGKNEEGEDVGEVDIHYNPNTSAIMSVEPRIKMNKIPLDGHYVERADTSGPTEPLLYALHALRMEIVYAAKKAAGEPYESELVTEQSRFLTNRYWPSHRMHTTQDQWALFDRWAHEKRRKESSKTDHEWGHYFTNTRPKFYHTYNPWPMVLTEKERELFLAMPEYIQKKFGKSVDLEYQESKICKCVVQ